MGPACCLVTDSVLDALRGHFGDLVEFTRPPYDFGDGLWSIHILSPLVQDGGPLQHQVIIEGDTLRFAFDMDT